MHSHDQQRPKPRAFAGPPERQGPIVSIKCGAARTRIGSGSIFRNIVAGVKHQSRIALHTNIADAQEHRACRFAHAFNAEFIAAHVVLPNDLDKVRDIPALAIRKRRSGRERRSCAGARDRDQRKEAVAKIMHSRSPSQSLSFATERPGPSVRSCPVALSAPNGIVVHEA
jgi:hypothetical protein